MKCKKSIDILTPVGDLLMITSYNPGAQPKKPSRSKFQIFFLVLVDSFITR